jgi:hypothetical protein
MTVGAGLGLLAIGMPFTVLIIYLIIRAHESENKE